MIQQDGFFGKGRRAYSLKETKNSIFEFLQASWLLTKQANSQPFDSNPMASFIDFQIFWKLNSKGYFLFLTTRTTSKPMGIQVKR